LFDSEKFYSELGKSYQPGIITQVVLAAFELRKQGKKLISLTGGSYDPDSVPYEPVKEILAEASVEDWQEILQYGNTTGSLELRGPRRHLQGVHRPGGRRRGGLTHLSPGPERL
jgi:DNA-binding transcriptional MocR family regulator